MEPMNSPENQNKNPVVVQKNIYKYLFFISIIILLIFTVYSYTLFTKTKNIEEVSVNPTPIQTTEKNNWITATNLGPFTFDYPFGWHVVDFFPRTTDSPSEIIIDPEPIFDAPRSGLLGKIYITDKSGIENPEEYFQKTIDDLKKSNTTINEEIISGEIGKIYHYSIKGFSDMGGDYSYEIYCLLFGLQNPSDNINKHIFCARNQDPETNDILRKIVLSIKAKQ